MTQFRLIWRVLGKYVLRTQFLQGLLPRPEEGKEMLLFLLGHARLGPWRGQGGGAEAREAWHGHTQCCGWHCASEQVAAAPRRYPLTPPPNPVESRLSYCTDTFSACVCRSMWWHVSTEVPENWNCSGDVHHGVPMTLAWSLAGGRNSINPLLTCRNGGGGRKILPAGGKE